MAHIKPEIKPDPDMMDYKPSPGAFDDEDVYEDTGDLEFNSNSAYSNISLAKVPLYLYEAWKDLPEDAEIEIGTIRVSQMVMPDGSRKVCLTNWAYAPRSTDYRMLRRGLRCFRRLRSMKVSRSATSILVERPILT